MVSKKILVFAAALMWMLAGLNIFVIGLQSHFSAQALIGCALSTVVFALFFFLIFRPTIQKNIARISALPASKQPLCRFLDAKSYLIMIAMMSLGVSLRAFHVLPESVIAFLYRGLGAALFAAGMLGLYKLLVSAGQLQAQSSSESQN